MNKRTPIIIIASILLLGLVSVLFYYDRVNLVSNYEKESKNYKTQITALKNQITEKDKEKSENVFANITSDWKTYKDIGLGIQVNVPPKVNIQDYFNDDINRFVSFVSDDVDFEVRLKEAKNKNGAGTFDVPFEEFYYLDFPIDSTAKINNMMFNIYKAPDGYCDGPGCGSPFISYATKKKDTFYVLSFSDDAELSEIENKILKTFEIID